MCTVKILAGVLLMATITFAQSDRGAISGTIADPTGAVVAGAGIDVRNVDNGATYKVGISATGKL